MNRIRGRAVLLGRLWLPATVAVLVLGLVGSALGGLAVRRAVDASGREAFNATADNVGETLSSLIGRDADFVATLRLTLGTQRHWTPSAFDAWYRLLKGTQRQIGGVGTAVVAAVPARRVAAFQAARDADPAYGQLFAGQVLPVPRDHPGTYCLLAAGAAVAQVSTLSTRLVQADWCRRGTLVGNFEGPALQAATRTGQLIAQTIRAPGISTTFLIAAIYRGGARPATVAGRARAVTGWVVSSFDLDRLVTTAIRPDAHLAVSLHHANPGQPAQLVGGAARGRGPLTLVHRESFSVDGRWSIVVRGAVASRGLSATTQGVLVSEAGVAVSFLLFLTLWVMGRSRERALALVALRTRQLRHQARHDPLTGLPNRVLAVDRAEEMLARARAQRRSVAAFYIDLDGFKQINDSFGHAAGDQVLCYAAERLRATIRDGDLAARLSGDEFVVLVEGEAEVMVEQMADRLLAALNAPYDLPTESGRRLRVTASVGVACGVRPSAEQLLAEADIALYAAKEAGRGRHVVFTAGMRNPGEDRVALKLDLAGALEAQELHLVYQPILDLRSSRLVGVEALVRWRHPVRGLVAPDIFIPIAEESGLIVPIGRWVLQAACAQAARWQAQGHSLGMAVNVSTRQLETAGFLDDVRDALGRSGLAPAALTIELTETTLMRDAQASAAQLATIKELGIRVAIDDFGTGYSSLAYLRQFPADTLKIDRSFVQAAGASRQSEALLRMLIRLGKSLGLETLGEGIELPDQLDHLQAEGCDLGQGYLFSPPVDADALTALLEEPQAPAAAVRI